MDERLKFNPDFGKDKLKPNIAAIGPDRWQDYREIYLQAIKDEPVMFWSPMDIQNTFVKKQKEQDWRELLNPENNFMGGKNLFLGAEEAGKYIGMVNAVLEDNKATIYNLYATKPNRGRGIGRQLMEAVMAEIKKDPEIKKVALEVYETQAEAIKLYESLGFKKIREREPGQVRKGKELKELIMELDLKPSGGTGKRSPAKGKTKRQ